MSLRVLVRDPFVEGFEASDHGLQRESGQAREQLPRAREARVPEPDDALVVRIVACADDGAVDETSRQPPNHVRCEQTGVDDIRRMLLEGRAKPAYTGWQIPMTTEVQAALGDAEVLLRSGARSGPEPGLHLDGCGSDRSHPPRILGRVRERLPRHVM